MTDNDCKEDINEVYESVRDEKVTELEILKQSCEEKKQLADKYYDQLLRLKAEFENYRNRVEKEKQTHRQWGKEEVLLKQINLYDVLEQAYASTKTNASLESIQKGLELIKLEFSKMLTGEGVIEIDCLGKTFDPKEQEAVDFVEAEEENKVADVLMKGYTFNSRVIRPARVKITKKQQP